MRTITKLLTALVVVLLLIFVGAVAYRFTVAPAANQPAVNPVQLVSAAFVPPPTLVESLQKRTSECTPELQAAFVKAAEQINDAFEDSYLLALSSPRIGLTPVVRDTQQLERDMASLAADSCAKPVQAKVVEAYNKATNEILNFMQDSDAYVSMFTVEYDLREAAEYLALYSLSPQVVMLDLDNSQRNAAIRKGEPLPQEIAYLQAFDALDAHGQCVQAAPLRPYALQAYEASKNRFRSDPLPDSTASTTDGEATPEETDPCADIPVVTNPQKVQVEYQLFGEDARATTVESVWVDLPGGETYFAESLQLPYTRTVEFLTGHRASISAWPTGSDEKVRCTLIVDGKIVAEDRNEDEYDSLNCSTILE